MQQDKLKKFYRHDPAAHLLINWLKLNPLKIVLIMLFITAVYSVINPPDSTLFYVWRLLLYPSLAGYYLWASSSMFYLLTDLEQRSIINITEADWSLSLRIYRLSIWKYLSICLAIISGALFLFSRPNYRNSFLSLPWLGLLKILGAMFGSYMAFMTTAILIINAWLIWAILRPKEIEVEPLHPDRCGGLKPLSRYSLKSAYLIATFGTIIGLIEYRLIIRGIIDEFWFIHLSIPIYIILSLAAFFVPLITAHLEMESTRNVLLKELSTQFQNDYKQLMVLALSSDTELLSKAKEKVKQLEEIYERTSKFPVWPFDIQSLRQYVLSLMAPLVPLLIAILQKLIEFWLKKWGVV